MEGRRCQRKGCKNTGCILQSDRYGYICDDCFYDLEQDSFISDIKKFMESDKKDKVIRLEEEFKIMKVGNYSVSSEQDASSGESFYGLNREEVLNRVSDMLDEYYDCDDECETVSDHFNITINCTMRIMEENDEGL